MTSSPLAADHVERVLIVDDERANRQLLEVMLSWEGFEMISASSGEEALALASAHSPDIVLLDVMMPGMDGYQVASRLKGNAATRNIPIIMITALDDREARLRGLGAGAEEFLTKPVDRAELSVRVRNLLRLKAFGDYHDKYSKVLEGEVGARARELIESERLYRSTFDASPVGIVHVGLDGRWLRVNQRMCDLLGYSRDELEGCDVAQLTQSEPSPAEQAAMTDLVSGTETRVVLPGKRFVGRNGDDIRMRVNSAVHRNADGRAQHFITVMEPVIDG